MRFFAFFLTILAVVSLASAQNSGLRGQVVDELGAAIPNAEVNLIGSDGRQRTTKSNANGEFAFPNAPPGVYTLTSAYKGFQTHVQEGVKVPGVQLKVVMAVATVNEAVETKADEGVSVEPDQNMTATVLGEEFIENLPDNEDDLNDYLQALAGPAAGAASGGEGSAEILVDGFSGGHLPPREAIQQIKINNSPFSAEFQNPGYSRVEIITKPGFGDWRGGGGIGYRNANLDARNPFLDPKPESKPDFSQQRYNFNLGGPIIKKKVSFFMYGDRTRNSGDGISKAITLENTNPTLVPASSENIHFGLHNDYTLNDKNTLNLGYHYGSSKNLDPEFLYRFGGGFGGGVGGGNNLFLPERGTDSRNSYHSLRIGETWIISSNLINEMRMRYSRENSTTAARTPGLSINVLDSFFGGGGSYPSPSEARSDEIEVHNYLTLTHKRHTIKGGLQFTHLFNRDFNESNFLGTYTFANLNEYQTALANMGTPLARAQTFSISGGDPYLFYRRYTAGVFLQDDIRMSQRLTLSFGLRQEFQSQLRDKNNWSPRFGFAWSPFSSKTVFRGGAGLFYNLLSDGSYENTIRYNGLTQTNTIIRNALYPDPFAFDPTAAEEISSVTPTVYSLDPNLKAPYTINYNLSVEQQLPRGLVATISYIHVNGVHLFRLRNINAPFPGTDQRPNPAQGSIYDYESTGRSTFDGLFFRFQRRFSQRLTFFANYGLSWARSDTYGGLPANNYDLHSEWGRSSSDRRHNFSTIVNLNLPHGFRLNPIVNAYTGRPFNITTGVDDNGDFQLTDRPAGINRNADLPASLYSLLPDRLICLPGTTPFSSAGGTACNTSGNPLMPVLIPQMQLRDFLTQYYPNGVKAEGPGNFNVNLYLSKTIGFGKRGTSGGQIAQGGGGGFGGRGGGGIFGGGENARFNVTFTLGVSNLFNHPNYGQDGGTLGAAFFGIPSSANPPRQFDFLVRFGF